MAKLTEWNICSEDGNKWDVYHYNYGGRPATIKRLGVSEKKAQNVANKLNLK